MINRNIGYTLLLGFLICTIKTQAQVSEWGGGILLNKYHPPKHTEFKESTAGWGYSVTYVHKRFKPGGSLFRKHIALCIENYGGWASGGYHGNPMGWGSSYSSVKLRKTTIGFADYFANWGTLDKQMNIACGFTSSLTIRARGLLKENWDTMVYYGGNYYSVPRNRTENGNLIKKTGYFNLGVSGVISFETTYLKQWRIKPRITFYYGLLPEIEARLGIRSIRAKVELLISRKK